MGVALVTGGTSGLGRAAAMAFAVSGSQVVLTGRNAERGESVVDEIRRAGGEAVFMATDLADIDTPAALVAFTVREFGRVDYAFNNAAEVEPAKPLHEYSEQDFDRAVQVGLRSVWLCMKHEIAQMLKQSPRGGAIVNTSSVNALGGVPGNSFYAMAKAGIVALTKSAALEYGKQDIRVNALVAGAFRTPMLEGVMNAMAGGDAEQLARVEETYASYVAMGRIGRPEEAAQVVVWLCSPAASYVTGHSMIVDGGLSAPYR